MIAQYVLGYAYRDKDEFSKRDFIHDLDLSIAKMKSEARPEDRYTFSEEIDLKEYDFDKSAFPISDHSEDDVYGRKRYRVITSTSGSSDSFTKYAVLFTNEDKVESIPVSLDEAKALAPALRKSRRAKLTYRATLDSCTEENDGGGAPIHYTKIINLNISEVALKLEVTGDTISYKPPQNTTRASNTHNPVIAAPPVPKVAAIAPLVSPLPSTVEEMNVAPVATPRPQLVRGPTYKAIVSGAPELNVREAPASTSGLVGKISAGEQVEVIGEPVANAETQWVPVIVGSNEGWVNSEFLRANSNSVASEIAPAATAPLERLSMSRKAIVSGAPELNVREAPVMNSALVVKVSNGQLVEITGIPVANAETQWTPVSIGSQHGWANSKFLQSASATEGTPTNSAGGLPPDSPTWFAVLTSYDDTQEGRASSEEDLTTAARSLASNGDNFTLGIYKADNGKLAVTVGKPHSEAEARALADLAKQKHLLPTAYPRSGRNWKQIR